MASSVLLWDCRTVLPSFERVVAPDEGGADLRLQFRAHNNDALASCLHPRRRLAQIEVVCDGFGDYYFEAMIVERLYPFATYILSMWNRAPSRRQRDCFW